MLVGPRDWNGSGATWLFLGPVSGSVTVEVADLVIRGANDPDGAGDFVRGGTDADGDGIPDLLIGAQDAGYTGTSTAQVCLCSGVDLLGWT